MLMVLHVLLLLLSLLPLQLLLLLLFGQNSHVCQLIPASAAWPAEGHCFLVKTSSWPPPLQHRPACAMRLPRSGAAPPQLLSGAVPAQWRPLLPACAPRLRRSA